MQLTAATLEHGPVRLEPFAEAHRAGLIAAAADPAIWTHIPYPVAREGYGAWFDWLREEQAAGRWTPFAVVLSAELATFVIPGLGDSREPGTQGQTRSPAIPWVPDRAQARVRNDDSDVGEIIVGQSCYLNIRPEHAGVEIGGTWYAPHAQGTFVNPTAKLLLLGHAFACGAERVELKTDALNARSRAAMLKLGCTFEGVHRRHLRRVDGSWRDTAWYSIIREEWDEVRMRLEARLAALA